MNVFIDTEFTDLLNPTIISIGFVAEDGRSLYLELLDWTPAQCSDFVKEVVLPLLDQEHPMTDGEAAQIIHKFFDEIKEPVKLMADSGIDFQLFGELLFSGQKIKPRKLAEALIISPSIEGELVRENLYAGGLRRHHAVDDAKALMAAWKCTNA